MLKSVICAGCALILVPLGAAADPEVSDSVPGPLVTTVSFPELKLLLDEVGAASVAMGRSDAGAPFVFGQMGDGLTFGAYTVCAGPDGTDCTGLELMAVYSTAASLEEITRIDQDYAAISLYKADDGTVRVSRYVILDNGVTWGNLVENVKVFQLLCGKVAERLRDPSSNAAQE